MPGGSQQSGAGYNGLDSGRQPVGTQRQKQPTNGYYSTGSTNTLASSSTTIAKRIGSSRQNDSLSNQQLIPLNGLSQTNTTTARATKATGPKSARDLSNLIDLMPPLSIEPGTKRLILAKKLDRENLDRYIQAGGYQTSTSSGSMSSTSSASLTVHIKCQLRDRSKFETSMPELQSNTTASANSSTPEASMSRLAPKKSSLGSANSILIPVHLIVTDENDNWPNFIASPYIIDLNESAQIGSLLQGNEIVAVDNDQQGPLSTIEYSIVAGSYWSDSFSFLNPLDSRSLIVKDNRFLDFESQSKITLRVMASDQGDPPNWAITSLYVNLLDQDDSAPVFNEDKYHGAVKENRPGEMIELSPRRMIARDGDKNLNAAIIYSFHVKTNQSIHFDLDPDLGRLSLKKSLPEDRAPSTKQPFCLLIRASQVDNPNRWTVSMINVRPPKMTSAAGQLEELLAMQNEHQVSSGTNHTSSPSIFKFAQPNYTVEVSEAAPVGSTILTVRAHWTGRERPQDGVVAHELLDNEQGYFSLDELTGRLILNKSLDYEMHQQMSVRILATYEQFEDSGGESRRARLSSSTGSGGLFPKLVCDITRININIINQNEYTPEFSHEQYNFQLSVSDLIANFDQSKSLVDETSDAIDRKSASPRFSKRFGELVADSNAEDPMDDLGYKALQLGQVFCADRDHGDKVTLQLTGSKASLFYLTQDGRLYLPLVNVSTIPTIANNRVSSETPSTPASAQYSWPQSQKTINNRFMLSRLFGQRRSDQSASLETMDRDYLNFLLSEISNLGRLRLKVLAHDDGHPESKQSTALIVVSIISIDNFILQRAPQLTEYSDGSNHLSSEASYETSNRFESHAADQDQHPRSQAGQQVMMIPSANGKSFVQINPDIIGNLLSSHGGIQAGDATNKSSSSYSSKLSPDSLDSAASNAVSHSVSAGEPSGQNQVGLGSRFQQPPPSLLLVDDDGAKFVAMPAAIEVYNQQVQEAAAGQLARQRGHGYLNERRSSQDGGSIWSFWRGLFGFGDQSNNNNNGGPGPLYWANVSTAILLHLAILAVIVTLVSRFRSTFRGSSRQSEDSNLSNSSLWPRRFPKLSLLGTANDSNTTHPVINILDHNSPGDVPFMISGSPSDCDDRYNFPSSSSHQRDNSNSDMQSGDNNISTDYEHRRQQSTSSGVVVSAISKGYKAGGYSRDSGTAMTSHLKQQNLFDHLKLTINKMLDIRDKDGCIEGQVTIKPLDTETEVFDSCNRIDYAADRAFAGSPKPTPSDSHQTDSNGKSISTFVGSSSPQKHRRVVQATLKEETTKAVVSISVKAPPKGIVDTSLRSAAGQSMASGVGVGQSSNSNSSSVVSLVSMSSSISNKISAAVVQTANSDTSSIDSSTLFNGRQLPDANPQATKSGASQPPAPPPLPPPPSLIQVRVDGSITSTSSGSPRKSASVATSKTTPIQQSVENRRLVPPQNPVHVKLRQQAMSEQMASVGDAPKAANGRASGRLQQVRPPTSTGGRREARTQANLEHRNLPPTPPPMPANGIITSAKTVSPTTSVDRGYESFQSYTSSSQQPQKHRQASQFSSLQEYDMVNQHYVPQSGGPQPTRAHPSGSTFANLPDSDNTGRHPRPAVASKLRPTNDGRLTGKHKNFCSTSGKSGTTTTGECDTEDDDFYYCNKVLDPNNHQLKHSGPIGSLLSDYASHTYKHQVSSGNKTARKESRPFVQPHQQVNGNNNNNNKLRKQLPSMADHQHQLQTSRVLGRSANNYHSGLNNSNRTTNDLISSSAASSSAASTSSSSCSPLATTYNSNSSGSQHHEVYHQNGCDILAQVGHSSTYQNYPLDLPASQHSGSRHHSLGCNVVKTAHHSHHNHHHHQSLPPGATGGGGGKKQLTWSDQVEMAA